MSFLFPTLLFLGLLATVPFIIHLFGERKYRPITFSSLKFLKEIERESMQKFHFRQYLILILRALWIIFLVLVLAQPFFKNAGGSLDSALIILDKSLSTEIDPDYKKFSEEIIEYFSSWRILSYDERSSTDSLMVSIKEYCDNTKGSDNIILITDVQNNRQNSEILDRIRELKQKLYILSVIKKNPNTALVELEEKPYEQNDDGLRYLQIQLSENQDNEKLSADIFVNSKRVGRAYGNEDNFADYYFSAEKKGELLCVAQCPEDDYPEDNTYYLVMPDFRNIKLLFVDHPQSASYASRAFEAMDNIQVTEISPELLATQDLNDYDFIWLNDLFNMGKSLQRSLLNYAEEQALLLSVPPEIMKNNIWEEQSGKLSPSPIMPAHISFNDLNASNEQEIFSVRRYYKSDLKTDKIIWELDSGEPLLFKNTAYILLSPLHFEWNEIGLSPYFLRTINRFIQNSLGKTQKSYDTGDIIPLNDGFTNITTPRDERINAQNYFSYTHEPGFYHFKNDEKEWTLAVNFPRDESEQGFLEISEDEKLSVETADLASIEDQIKGRKGQTFFFVLALLCIILEMYLIRKGESTE